MTPKQKTALIVLGLGTLGVGGILLASSTASASTGKRDEDEDPDGVVVTTPDGSDVPVTAEEPEAEEPEAEEPEAEEPEAEETEAEERDLSTLPVKPTAKTGYYIVKDGDSPWKVAANMTGDGARWKELQAANPQYDFNKQFWSGMQLKLPASWGTSKPAPVANVDIGPVTVEPAPDLGSSSKGVPPLVKAETSPALDPVGTVGLAHVLLQSENKPNWKHEDMTLVSNWQKATGTLVPDGKFGPKSAYRMAEEVGVLPYVRFWTHWDKNQGLKEYRTELLKIADRLEAENPIKARHAEALRLSAQREQAQSFPSKPAAQPSSKEVDAILNELGANAADAALDSILNNISSGQV